MGHRARAVELLRAREALAAAGYERHRIAALRKEGGDLVLATLVALFLDGEALDVAETERVLGDALGTLVDARLLRVEGSAVRRAVLVVPHAGVMVASDDPDYDGPDYVTGVQRPAHILALLTPRAPVKLVADIGTGCGILALLAARHAKRVVATDVNERALDLCELNAALNGIENIEVRQGSFLEPLADEKCDLIVSNPPFLVSPATDYVFRDAGRGDAVSEELVRGLEERLVPGGHAVVAISWVANDDDAIERPLGWVGERNGAVLLVTEVKDAVNDAEGWIRAAGSETPEDDFHRWRRWYEEQGIERLAYGAIAVRRGGNGRVVVPVDVGELGPAGTQVVRLLDAQDRRPAKLVLAPDARLEGSELSLVAGLSLHADLGEDADALRNSLGKPPTPLTQELYELGFLVEP